MLYTLIKALVKFALLILGLKSEGIHNLPKKGPIIVAANHVSNWDPLLVGVCLPRPIHFMAKAELYRNPLISWFLKSLNTIPIRRGTADRTAIHQALQVLKDNKVLGVFPEGTRRNANADSKGQLGAAMLALKSGTQIIPVACVGSARKIPWGWGKNRLVVKVGEPISLAPYQGKKFSSAILTEMTADIMKQINLLLD